jgi:gamma-butyrobetaine dioxygenase
MAPLFSSLASDGFSLLRPGQGAITFESATLDPWGTAARLFGMDALMVERQPIRPVAGVRSFAAGSGDAPLHTDSQRFRGVPSDAIVMICERPAERGGETTMVDAFVLLRRLHREAPDLFRALALTPRKMRFYFGEHDEPTFRIVDDAPFFTHPPAHLPGDAIGARIAAELPPPTRLLVQRDEVLIVDNRRMLHGRTAFSGNDRSFVRLLVWLPRRLSPADDIVGWARAAGAPSEKSVPLSPRAHAMLALLRGAPPGVIAPRLGVDEAELYRMREETISSAPSSVRGRHRSDDQPAASDLDTLRCR